MDTYKRRNLEQRIIKDADQTEYSAMLKNAVLVDDGLFDDKVSGALDDFEVDTQKMEAWHSLDLQYETAAGEVHTELLRRANLLGEAYPFEITGSQISYKGSKSHYYEFCLAVSTASNITQGNNVHLPRVFERTSAIIVKLYLGYESYSLHVGAPRDEYMGTTFHSSMQKVMEVTKEWIWGPMSPYPDVPTTTGDEGMDFVVWKNTPDHRPGKLFVIGQCACGDDWKDKLNDLDISKLEKWFRPISYVKPPVRSFTTPYHLSDMNLINAQLQAGMVFDRARLTIVAEKFASEKDITDNIPRIKELSSMIIC